MISLLFSFNLFSKAKELRSSFHAKIVNDQFPSTTWIFKNFITV